MLALPFSVHFVKKSTKKLAKNALKTRKNRQIYVKNSPKNSKKLLKNKQKRHKLWRFFVWILR